MKRIALGIIIAYAVIGLYAPFLASSQPLVVRFEGHWYFPLFRSLFDSSFYTKPIDLFFNALMFSLPVMLLGIWKRPFLFLGLILQIGLLLYTPPPPSISGPLRHHQRYTQHQRLLKYTSHPDTLWAIDHENALRRGEEPPGAPPHFSFLVMPLLREFHWQEDAGGSAALNRKVPWWEMTRINRKDLLAGLLFGVRVSLTVGLTAVALSLLIGMPLGAIAGYCGGRVDLFLSRFIEIWESMPTFFMLLTVVAILQSKSIFLIVLVLGVFGWTGFARYLRSEVLKQRNLAYVEASHSLGFRHHTILFSQILPNAIPPLLTLLPFSIMAAITSEAGLSFLGLGEEGSTSWGVLMDEGRTVFPAESQLLWPPAIALTILLIAIALVGDAVRDHLDPRLSQSK